VCGCLPRARVGLGRRAGLPAVESGGGRRCCDGAGRGRGSPGSWAPQVDAWFSCEAGGGVIVTGAAPAVGNHGGAASSPAGGPGAIPELESRQRVWKASWAYGGAIARTVRGGAAAGRPFHGGVGPRRGRVRRWWRSRGSGGEGGRR